VSIVPRPVVVAIAIAGLTAGCGGKSAHPFTGAEARRLADIAPAAPGWTWPHTAAKPIWDTSAASPTSDPLLMRFRRRTAASTSLGEASKEWQDADKLANLVVDVFRSSAAAHAVLKPFNDLSAGLAVRSGRITKSQRAAHLGDEAWVMWANGNGLQVTYHWRRRNLIFETHIHCFGNCPADIDTATRTWADAIDAASRRSEKNLR
jgi:hypothetical protein